MNSIYRLDSNGIPFEFPTCILPKTEYAKIISEINTDYKLYINDKFAIHYSVGTDNNYYLYYFENHGYDDYNIVEKFRL